jgi:aryl-alcohol dehydrogenase-like predicted oxidoreductase
VKLALGTVQFGQPYGVANTLGQPDEAAVRSILKKAAAAGVRVIDTASLYGESEAVLGRCLPAAPVFDIVTKTPKFQGLMPAQAVAALVTAWEASCKKLGLDRLYGLLLHDANDLLGPAGPALWQALQALQAGGRVQRIGASVYSAAQVDALLQRFPMDLVQLPLSLLDQRLVRGGQLAALVAAGVEIHARSAFLQGALLLPPGQLPPHLKGLGPYVGQIAAAAAAQKVRPLDLALRYVAGLPEVAAVVCGVESVEQFQQLAAVLAAPQPSLSPDQARACACDDLALVDPSRWSRA